MTKKQAERQLRRHLGPRFPQFRTDGDVLGAFVDEGVLLRGFIVDRSQANKDSFRLHAFVQLLTVPSDIISIALSRDLGRFDTAGDPDAAFAEAARAAEGAGSEYLALAPNVRMLASNATAMLSPLSDRRHATEVAAHGRLLEGDTDGARRLLEALEQEYTPPEVPYEHHNRARIQATLGLLTRPGGQAADTLRAWARQTGEALGLPGLVAERSQ